MSSWCLKLICHDPLQSVLVQKSVEIRICCFKAPSGIHDTQSKYRDAKVSYGDGVTLTLLDNIKLSFGYDKLINSSRIDERNLGLCKYLNLDESSVLQIDTQNLGGLLLLRFCNTKISVLNALPLINLEYLDFSYTDVSMIDTTNLCNL